VETVKRYYRIDRKEISFLRYLFESHENLAVVTTMDVASGVIRLSIAPDCVREVDEILANLPEDVMLEPVCREEAGSKDDLDTGEPTLLITPGRG